MKFPKLKQKTLSDCGPSCLASVLRFYGGFVRVGELRHWCGTQSTGTSLKGLIQGADRCGLKAQAFRWEKNRDLADLPTPCIQHVVCQDSLHHYWVLVKVDSFDCLIMDPASGTLCRLPLAEMEMHWSSRIFVQIEPGPHLIQQTPNSLLSWLLPLIKNQSNLLIQMGFLALVTAVLALAGPLYMRKLMDDIIPDSNTSGLLWLSALFVGLVGLRFGLSLIHGIFSIQFSRSINTELLTRSLTKIFQQRSGNQNREHLGQTVQRLVDSNKVQQALVALSQGLGSDGFFFVLGLIALFWLNSALGLLALLLAPAFSFTLVRLLRTYPQLQREAMGAFADLQTFWLDGLQGMDSLKTLDGSHVWHLRHSQRVDRNQLTLYQVGLQETKLKATWELLCQLPFILLFALGYPLGLLETLSVGGLWQALLLLNLIFPALGRLALLVPVLKQAEVALDRLDDLFQALPEPSGNRRLTHLDTLEMVDVSYCPIGSRTIFEKVSLHLKQNQWVRLLGPNGCGKSTLMKLIVGLENTFQGQILLNGIPLQEYDLKSIRQAISYVPQNIHIFNATLLENLTLGNNHRIPTVLALTQKMNSKGLVFQVPQGLQTVLGEKGHPISSGQRQLLGIMRALAATPQLLILDEALQNMDPHTEQHCWALLRELKGQLAILSISHQTPTPHFFDQEWAMSTAGISILKATSRQYAIRDVI